MKEAYRVEEKEVMSKTSQTTNQSWATIVIQPYEGEADSADVQEMAHQVMDEKIPASSRGAAKMLLYVKTLGKTYKQSIGLIFGLLLFSERLILPCVAIVFFIFYILVSILFHMEDLEPPAHVCKEKA